MATILIERQLLSICPTTTSIENTHNVVVDPHRRQTSCNMRTMRRSVSDDTDIRQIRRVGGDNKGVRLPAVVRPSQAVHTRSSNGTMTVSSTMVDRLSYNESLSSSCPELQHATRLTCLPRIVRTELPSVDQPRVVPLYNADLSSTRQAWNSPSRILRRGNCQQQRQQQQSSKHTTSLSRPNKNAFPAIYQSPCDWRKRRAPGGNILSVVYHEKNVASKNSSTWRTRTTTASSQPRTIFLPLCPAADLPEPRAATDVADVTDDELEDDVFDKCESWLLDVARANELQL